MMPFYFEDPDFRPPIVRKVVEMFERNPPFQRVVKIGFIVTDDDEEYDLPDDQRYFYASTANLNRRFKGNPEWENYQKEQQSLVPFQSNRITSPPRRAPSPPPPPRRHLPQLTAAATEPVESHAERRARLKHESKKVKEKAAKKRLKKQRQKERKLLEKLEKEKENPQKSIEVENGSQSSKAEESKEVNGNAGVGLYDTDSSSEEAEGSQVWESSEEEEEEEEGTEPESKSEELDMNSAFVSKAALVAKRQLEQKPKSERKEKKTPVQKETPPAAEQPNHNDVKKDTATPNKAALTPNTHSYEDHIKISTEFAVLGNQFASAGDFNKAVRFFTDAIKYNPTEFKLFGNRSFCFEKMQQYEKSLTDAELSLSMSPGWVKGLYRKGRALAGLKRYDEAAQAFKEVLKMDSSCADAAQELMRVQITQLMAYGFSREQSSNALIIHGTVNKALEVLSNLTGIPGATFTDSLPARDLQPPAPVVNITRAPPLPAANPSPHASLQSPEPKTPLQSRPLAPAQNMPHVQSPPKPIPNRAMIHERPLPPTPELFPVWVGNLVAKVTEPMVSKLFSTVGEIYSVRLLTHKRCAFINFTKQEYCKEAIRTFDGYELMGCSVIVRYPDVQVRIPPGMRIATRPGKYTEDQIENFRQNDTFRFEWRNGGGGYRPGPHHRPGPDHKGFHKR